MPAGLAALGIEQTTPIPPTTPASGTAAGGKSSFSRVLQAADHLSIVQKGAVITIKATMPDGALLSDEFTAGTQTTVPYGPDNTAERGAGWRGPAFVVTTKPKKGNEREDDYALDDDGRLIMSTLAKSGHFGKVDIKRVYDRIKG
jgi:hypothetical protein